MKTKNMSRDEWLKARQSGIGGSDVGAILGVNKWKSPLQLYFEKIGLSEQKSLDNEYVYWGIIFEDIVAREFTKRTNKKVRKVNKMFRHKEHDFMIANIDRAVVGESALLECKTTSEFNKDLWEGDEIPASYLTQVQHYLAVTGYEKAYIAVLIGGNKFIWKHIPRDEELIEYIISAEKTFWDKYIIGDEMPEMDGSEATTNFLKEMYKDSEYAQIELGKHADAIVEALDAIKVEEKEIKAQKQQRENELKALLKHDEVGFTKNYQVSWKAQNRTNFDKKQFTKDHPELVEQYSKTTQTRVLRIKQINESEA